MLPDGATFVGTADGCPSRRRGSAAICSSASLAIGAGPGGGELVKVTPDVRPAECQPDVAAVGEFAVTGITVGP